jgi:hypothetical protein
MHSIFPPKPLSPDASTTRRHSNRNNANISDSKKTEEHHIGNFDAATFFKLHDFDSNGALSSEEIKRTYGLLNPESDNVPAPKKDEVAAKVLDLFDTDRSGDISYAEFVQAHVSGLTLPDFGLGPGHHGDDEYEYEIHHWEKYHGDDTTEDELVHPEDIAHFAKHEREEREEEELERKMARTIIVENIPKKFLRKKE